MPNAQRGSDRSYQRRSRHGRIRPAGGLLLLASPRPRVWRVFVLSRLLDAVSFRASGGQAAGVFNDAGMAAAPQPCSVTASPSRDPA
jgi:hypothetical protein